MKARFLLYVLMAVSLVYLLYGCSTPYSGDRLPKFQIGQKVGLFWENIPFEAKSQLYFYQCSTTNLIVKDLHIRNNTYSYDLKTNSTKSCEFIYVDEMYLYEVTK